jgi:hypothetical protein
MAKRVHGVEASQELMVNFLEGIVCFAPQANR